MLLELAVEHPDVANVARAVQEIAPHLPGVLAPGYGRVPAYVTYHAIEKVAVEQTHKVRRVGLSVVDRWGGIYAMIQWRLPRRADVRRGGRIIRAAGFARGLLPDLRTRLLVGRWCPECLHRS